MSWVIISKTMEKESFNSLSRDHCTACSLCTRSSMRTFNSLSRDHYEALKVTEEMFKLILSTPSLGITEPDSGIFRLSAAFCRGALSHK